MQEDSLMNRALLKQDAKDAMKAANPHPVLTTLVFWAIQLAAQIILGIVSSICGFTTYFSAAISSGMYEDNAFLNYAPSIGAFLIYLVVAIVIGLLIGTVQFGYYAYSLKVFKHVFPSGWVCSSCCGAACATSPASSLHCVIPRPSTFWQKIPIRESVSVSMKVKS
mgnify:CR=1 FL=1